MFVSHDDQKGYTSLKGYLNVPSTVNIAKYVHACNDEPHVIVLLIQIVCICTIWYMPAVCGPLIIQVVEYTLPPLSPNYTKYIKLYMI